jgi:HK97 family phage major capsid protein
MDTKQELQDAVTRSSEEYDEAIGDYADAEAGTDAATIDAAYRRVQAAGKRYELARTKLQDAGGSRSSGSIRVGEPDMYEKGGRSFLRDAFASQVRGDPSATDRLSRHQAYEIEKRDMTSSTFGGLIPPQYLLDLYAKASRNGRVFADQCNRRPLPDTGISLIIPRLTQGTAADVQAAENDAVATQDVTEEDLTVPVRTIAGYVSVSRQALERGSYDDTLLFEDLVARYWQKLDAQALNGDGMSGALKGVLQTSGIATSTATGGDLIGCYPHIADVLQQIDTAAGGLGYKATKIVMHPRRWGAFVATVDSQHRPILGISGLPAFNVDGQGQGNGYGFVGNLLGLPVYTDANVPTDLGDGEDEDAIVVFSDPVVHLWERDQDPVTLAFEQRQGIDLEVDLVVAGYAAFTAGRYPFASGKVTGLTAPTFGS